MYQSPGCLSKLDKVGTAGGQFQNEQGVSQFQTGQETGEHWGFWSCCCSPSPMSTTRGLQAQVCRQAEYSDLDIWPCALWHLALSWPISSNLGAWR